MRVLLLILTLFQAGVVRPVEDNQRCFCQMLLADQPHLHVITTPCCGKRCHEMCLAKHYLEHEEGYRVCPVCHGIDEVSCRPAEWRVVIELPVSQVRLTEMLIIDRVAEGGKN